MKKITTADRLRYWFDNLMAKGTPAMIGMLFVASALLIILISAIVSLTPIGLQEDGTRLGFVQVAWMSLMRTLDAGTMGGDSGNWWFLLAMFIVTLGGVFIVSTLIGVLGSGIEGRIEELRKGRSLVVEENHTVILGWSEQVFAVVSELASANANQRRACIAILADKDKVEMEDELRGKVSDFQTTHLVCRTGSPMDLADLEIVNPHAAKSIIILAPETADADSQTIKAILALTNNPHRRQAPYHITAEIRNPKNLEAAQLVGKDEAELVKVDELIARITAQTCRQSGLSTIYTELLDFGGDEIYIKEEPSMVGKTFGEALFIYEDSAVMGILPAGGQASLNPPMNTVIQPGDKLVVVSEDDDTMILSGLTDYKLDAAAIHTRTSPAAGPEHTLILGWNRRAPIIIHELDAYVAPGSTVKVLSGTPQAEMEEACNCDELQNITLTIQHGDTIERRTLDSLDVTQFDHIITLSSNDLHNAQEADARSLVTLLHLRDISEKTGRHLAIVSEILDVRNRELAEVSRADDFIVSDKLISLLMSQISENKSLAPVFEDLFDPEGSELYLNPANDYVQTGKPLNFYTVLEAARRQGHVAIGYRLKALSEDPKNAYGVVINPEKSKQITFTEADRIIVLAEG